MYKMPKETHFGAKNLIRKTPVTWWPKKEYKLYSMGRFDIYPLEFANLTRD